MPKLEPLQQVDRTCVRWRGRKLIYFSGCDYFRLASHPVVLDAVSVGLKKFGLNVAASRLTTGHHVIYDRLERALAKFFGAKDALLVSNGYMTNLIVAQALAGEFSHALLDERAHPALQDAADQLNCPALKFKHRDVENFARALARCGRYSRPIVLTDGMFANDGSVAPLRGYLQLLPRDGKILVDDAHGAGVLGKTGKGTPEFENLSRDRIDQCITLSKAFGVYGGAILGTRELRDKILRKSRAFIGSTPPSLPMATAALESVRILSRGNRLRERLNRNAELVKDALCKGNLRFSKTPGPIIHLELETSAGIARLKRRLLAAGIHPPFLKYPGGPANGYFRFVISSEHTPEQLRSLVETLVP